MRKHTNLIFSGETWLKATLKYISILKFIFLIVGIKLEENSQGADFIELYWHVTRTKKKTKLH